MVNKAILIGRITRDPEVKHLDGGNVVANFSIATGEKYKNKSGEMVESEEFHNIVAWKHLALLAEKWFHKGQLLYVEGKISTRKWEKDGVTRYTTEIIAYTIQMLGKKDEPKKEEPKEKPKDSIEYEEDKDRKSVV